MRRFRRAFVRKLPILFIAWTGFFLLFDVVAAIHKGGFWSWFLVVFMVACLTAQIHFDRKTRALRLERAVDYTDEPIPPQNVQLRLPDGTSVPVELVYVGWVDDSHQWMAVTPFREVPGAVLTADWMPVPTSLVLEFVAPE